MVQWKDSFFCRGVNWNPIYSKRIFNTKHILKNLVCFLNKLLLHKIFILFYFIISSYSKLVSIVGSFLYSGNKIGYKYFCSHLFSLKTLKDFARWRLLLRRKKKINRKIGLVDYLTERKEQIYLAPNRTGAMEKLAAKRCHCYNIYRIELLSEIIHPSKVSYCHFSSRSFP